jgi:CDP-diacylglycerol--glycerol-3-phosphate 3-phosphatidyltransferase
MRSELLFFLGMVGFVLLTMVVYLFTAAGRRGADQTGRGGSFVLGFWVRNWFYWFIRPLTQGSLALGLSPFFYNALAVVFGLASLWLYATGHLASAGWMVLLSGFADVMDGEVARGQGVADARGAFLDSTLDRFAEFFAFIGMAWLFRDGVGALLVVLALGGSLLVSYTRARGESVGVLCKLGVMQRAERMLLMGLGSILDPSVSARFGWAEGTLLMWIVAVIAAGTVGTSVFRTFWIARELRGKG